MHGLGHRARPNQRDRAPALANLHLLGQWHYGRRIYDRHGYKSAQTVVHTLIDVVSKNGNLLLSVPVRGNGSIDDQERAIVENIATWMQANGESIYGTRPWKIFGEGPAQASAAALSAQGFNEGKGKGKPFGAQDIRFVAKGEVLYATVLTWPTDGQLLITSLATGNPLRTQPVRRIELLGHAGGALTFEPTAQGLRIALPAQPPAAGRRPGVRVQATRLIVIFPITKTYAKRPLS